MKEKMTATIWCGLRCHFSAYNPASDYLLIIKLFIFVNI